MLQPIPSLPIPGQKQDPNYSISDGVGGVLGTTIVMTLDPSDNLEIKSSSGYAIIDYSNLIGSESNSIIRQGYIVVTITSYASSNILGVSSPYQIALAGMIFYSYPYLTCSPIVNSNNLLGVYLHVGGTMTGAMEFLIEINLLTVQYQYPATFTQQELFEDLKTLPEVVIKGLKKLDCEKMQGALGLLNSFNDAKLVS